MDHRSVSLLRLYVTDDPLEQVVKLCLRDNQEETRAETDIFGGSRDLPVSETQESLTLGPQIPKVKWKFSHQEYNATQ